MKAKGKKQKAKGKTLSRLAFGTENSALSIGPIGVFDSGIGGLTVVKRITEILPAESIIYIGDTARIPYGPKSPEAVRGFSLEIGNYLASIGAKAIVIACNTASSYGLSTLSATLPVPVIGVVGPGAQAAVQASKTGRIGVIGTRGTVASEAYQNAILAIRGDARVYAAAAPLLVPLVEEGHLDDAFTAIALKLYLDPLLENNIDTLVLGCTHYPLLESVIKNHVGAAITVVDSALATARSLEALLLETGLSTDSTAALAAKKSVTRNRYFCTDNPEGFRLNGQRFLGIEITHVQWLPLEDLVKITESAPSC